MKKSRLKKIFIVRKLLGCAIGGIIATFSIWKAAEWAFQYDRDPLGTLWGVLFFIGLWIFAYFKEEKFLDYKSKKVKRHQKRRR